MGFVPKLERSVCRWCARFSVMSTHRRTIAIHLTLTHLQTAAQLQTHTFLSLLQPSPPKLCPAGSYMAVFTEISKKKKKKDFLNVFFLKKHQRSEASPPQKSVLTAHVRCSLRCWSSYDIHAWWLIVGRKRCIILSHATFIAWGWFPNRGRHSLWRLQAERDTGEHITSIAPQ